MANLVVTHACIAGAITDLCTDKASLHRHSPRSALIRTFMIHIDPHALDMRINQWHYRSVLLSQ